MSNKKISCGGFSVDNETIIEENGVLKAIGGGSSGILVINGTVGEEDPDNPGQYALTVDKTVDEILAADACVLTAELSGATYDLQRVARSGAVGEDAEIIFAAYTIMGENISAEVYSRSGETGGVIAVSS